jgi:hypothetical protein
MQAYRCEPKSCPDDISIRSSRLTTSLNRGSGPISAKGQKRTFAVRNAKSALPPKADICSATDRVCFGPKADMYSAEKRIDYSITSSAINCTSRVIVSPSSFAVFRFMTNSNLVGCSTGSSEGLAPLRILCTNGAADRNKSPKFAP